MVQAFFFSVGLFIGFCAFVFIYPVWPGVMDRLVHNPNRYRVYVTGKQEEEITTRDYPKSTFGFFSYLFPGQEQMIERGGRFIRGIMNYDHHMHKGEQDNPLTPKHAEYWENVLTVPPYHDSHPIPFPILKLSDLNDRPLWPLYSPLSILFWVWKRWIYARTGAVFTGLYWYQRPRAYPMERFRRVTQSDGSVKLVRIEDYSQQYRVAHFQYPALITGVSTQDNIPMKVLLNIVAAVFNPYLAAYNTDDDWPTRFLGSVSDRITSFIRPRELKAVWTAENPAAARELAEFVTAGGQHTGDPATEGSTCAFGIRIIETQVLSIEPVNPEQVKKLGAFAEAKVQRQADQELAAGKAAYIREEGNALKEHPYADIVVQTEGLVRAAEASAKGGGNIFLNGPSINAGDAAVLNQLKKQQKGGS